jgi:hypothetical protein
MKIYFSILLLFAGITMKPVLSISQISIAKITVKIPGNGLQGDTSVFLTGTFNNWNTHDSSYIMKRVNKTHYSLRVPCFENKKYEYKYCLGSWAGAETTVNGDETQNRIFIAHKKKIKIKDTVACWELPKQKSANAANDFFTKEQLDTLKTLKDSSIKNLASSLPQMQAILKKIMLNLLAEHPDSVLNRQFSKEANVIVARELDVICDLLLKISGILKPEQKQVLLKAINNSGQSKDFINSILKKVN